MTIRTIGLLAALSAAIVAGTLADRPDTDPPLTIGGYRVLAGDFHVHPAIVSAAAVSPWDLVLEARRQRLDVIAITPHNSVFDAAIGRWFAKRIGGPLVLTGEEIRGWSYHLIAVGIDRRIAWTRDARTTIDAVHAQGGVAILAHPGKFFWPAFDERAMAALDGAEVVYPSAFAWEKDRDEFRTFYASLASAKLRRSEGGRRMTAIGSSDFHGLGRLGIARTHLFVKDTSEEGVLDALRAGRTVVYDPDGSAFGDAQLIGAAAKDGRLPARERDRYAALHALDGGALGAFSRIAGVASLFALVVQAFPGPPKRAREGGRPARRDRQP
jgi:predicted metal-dependent phosphoesterase TrpH